MEHSREHFHIKHHEYTYAVDFLIKTCHSVRFPSSFHEAFLNLSGKVGSWLRQANFESHFAKGHLELMF